MKKVIFLLLMLLCFNVPVFAEVKEIIAEGSYVMGDGETPSVAQERAIVEAKRMAIEQAGTYLESFTEVINMQLTKDEIRTFASGVLETTVIDKKRDIIGGEAFKFWVKVKCLVNSDSIQTMRNKIQQDKSAMDILKKVQENYDKSQQEIAELKRQLALANSANEKKQLENRVVENEQKFTATQWFEKGRAYIWHNYDVNNAIVAYTKAIELNPQYAEAYYYRGLSKKDDDSRIADFTKAIELNPQYVEAYRIRESIYMVKEQYDLALADCNKIIELKPHDAEAYYHKGFYCGRLGRNLEAIQAFKMCMQYATSSDEVYIKSSKKWIKALGSTI